jgi:hypothetical protein
MCKSSIPAMTHQKWTLEKQSTAIEPQGSEGKYKEIP